MCRCVPSVPTGAIPASLRRRLIWGNTLFSWVAIHLTKPFFGSIHQEELRDAAAALAGIKGPFILAGDFNSGILATDVQDFMGGAWACASLVGSRTTWPVFAPAIGLPIDHIMISDPLAFERLERLPDAIGSNHFGAGVRYSCRPDALNPAGLASRTDCPVRRPRAIAFLAGGVRALPAAP